MSDAQRPVTRRSLLAGAAALAAFSELGCTTTQEQTLAPARAKVAGRMPVAFVPHGGGPWPFVDVGFGSKSEGDVLAEHFRSLRALPKTPPKAVLMISAHWEEPAVTAMTGTAPPMLYDYSGFPRESYSLTWPAPGHPEVAARARQLVSSAGFPTAENASRGFDHGTFVVMKVAYPDAAIPTVQLSLKRGLDAQEHLALGRSLAPLRDEGVMIVASGMTFHNLRSFGPSGAVVSEAFDGWLRDATTREPAERDRKLGRWTEAPHARDAHPREEHLLPLLVAAGAAGSDTGRVAYRGTFSGVALSAYRFG